MKPRPRPLCRPGARPVQGPSGLQRDGHPARNLVREGSRAVHKGCAVRASTTLYQGSATQQHRLGAGVPPTPRTHEVTGATLMRNLEPGLAQLPAKQRDVLVLVWLEEMTHEQAAHVLGLPLGTVKSRLRLALEQLHRWLASADDLPDPASIEAP